MRICRAGRFLKNVIKSLDIKNSNMYKYFLPEIQTNKKIF